jgi:hypothetical protein
MMPPRWQVFGEKPEVTLKADTQPRFEIGCVTLFRRTELPGSIRTLENAMSRAYWIAGLVVDARPLLSIVYLTKSYKLSPDNPPNLQVELARHPRPQFCGFVNVLKTQLAKPLRK